VVAAAAINHPDNQIELGEATMDIPSLNDVILQMQNISGAPAIDPDEPLLGIEDIDSLDMMEWLYDFQERYPHLGAQESVFEDISDSTTFRHVYEEILAAAPLAASPS
jgi:hypothetical protein